MSWAICMSAFVTRLWSFPFHTQRCSCSSATFQRCSTSSVFQGPQACSHGFQVRHASSLKALVPPGLVFTGDGPCFPMFVLQFFFNKVLPGFLLTFYSCWCADGYRPHLRSKGVPLLAGYPAPGKILNTGLYSYVGFQGLAKTLFPWQGLPDWFSFLSVQARNSSAKRQNSLRWYMYIPKCSRLFYLMILDWFFWTQL